MKPLSLSVIIVVRNGARFIAEALESIARGDLQPTEIVVVDGRSSDDTVAIARRFAAVRIVEQTGDGCPDAYNLGVRLARGDLIGFLSHDDRWTPDKLRVQVARMTERPELLYTTARVRFFLEQGCAPPPGLRPELLTGDHGGRIMETLVARREAFERVGLFDTTLKNASDVDWFARAQDLGITTEMLPDVLLDKRIHDRNTTRAGLNNPELLAVLRRSILRRRPLSPS